MAAPEVRKRFCTKLIQRVRVDNQHLRTTSNLNSHDLEGSSIVVLRATNWHCVENKDKYLGSSSQRSPTHLSLSMAGNPNTHVVFGSSRDSYFIGHGRRYSYANMPESFTKHIQTQMNISMTLWIRCAPSTSLAYLRPLTACSPRVQHE